MPELPEVETTACLIRPLVQGQRIEAVQVRWARTLGGMSVPAFRAHVVGTRIAAVRRRAKYIVMDLDRDGDGAGALLIHLRMSGRLLVESAAGQPGPYVRVGLGFEDDQALRFHDVRKFGRFRYVADAERALAHLGPEPLGPAFTPTWLKAELGARRRMLKPLLLDQTFLAGLGNIYVDEALHRARLHPERRADTVGRRTLSVLHAAIQDILRAAIKRQGSSFDGFYRTPEGKPGDYQHEFRVYGREGEPCPRCGHAIAKLVVGQRGTHVCRACQRLPRPRAK